MKSKEDIMDSGDDYDQMLRAEFEACDSAGLGLLTLKDFETLCQNLSMQEHYSLLSEVLFPEENKRKLLSYETFRDTLILFLTGDARFDSNGVVDSTGALSKVEDCWNNSSEEYQDENRIESGSNIENPELELSKVADENCYRKPMKNSNSPSPGRKYRKYGRRTKPDNDMLFTEESGDSNRQIVLREVQLESSQPDGIADQSSPDKAVEVSFASEDGTPSIMQGEVFTGTADCNAWTNPDSLRMPDINANVEDDTLVTGRPMAVRSQIERAWSTVVGDSVGDAVDESQLGYLCAELGLGYISSSEDLSDLFSALDGDNDGLVRFHEFSDRMSEFLSCDQSNTEKIGYEEQCLGDDQPDTDAMDKWPSCGRPVPDFTNVDETELFLNGVDEDAGSSGSQATVDIVDASEYALGSRRPEIPSTINEVSTSPASSLASSGGPQTSDSRGHLSIDNDTSPLCPPVVSVDPRQLAATSRTRRRRRSSAVAASNPASARQQRRRSSRSIPLPYFHPASIRRVEELPLSYLLEENERYVSLYTLQQNWELEGLEDTSSVLDALQLSSADQSISVEALSEVIEMEFNYNAFQRAALALFKRGINHYRSLFYIGEAERSKLENRIQHLESQLHEYEERSEKAETNFRHRVEQVETKYKVENKTLREELCTFQSNLKEKEREAASNREEQLNDIREENEKLKASLEVSQKENQKLTKEKEELESKLMDAEDVAAHMQEDVEIAYRGIALCNRRIAAQEQRCVEHLRLQVEQARTLKDYNDELFDRMQQSERRWSSFSQSKRRSTRMKAVSSATYKTDSSNSPPSEGYHLSPTCQFFITDSPEAQFVTSSFAGGTMEDKKIITSDAFAFLTPSSTRVESRIQTFASSAIAPLTVSPEPRSSA